MLALIKLALWTFTAIEMALTFVVTALVGASCLLVLVYLPLCYAYNKVKSWITAS